MEQWTYIKTNIGWIRINGRNGLVTEVSFMDDEPNNFQKPVPEYLQEAAMQLSNYFRGQLQEFTISVSWNMGTTFQKEVWKELVKIPYGYTKTYLEIALKLGDRNAVRAVGAACGQNPVGIIVPCHRVIGSNGDLTGYAGGLKRKKALLALENPMSYAEQSSLF